MSTIKQRPIGHMPFPGHRTQEEVRQDEEEREAKRQAAKWRAIELSYGFTGR